MSEQRAASVFTTKPGKIAYTTYFLLWSLAKLPFWLLISIPRGLRQNPRWTWRQAVSLRMIRAIVHWLAKVEATPPFDLTPGAEKDQWVTYLPAESKYYTGVVLSDPATKPAKIGATWYPSVPTKPTTKVLLHFHGGAFVTGNGRKKDFGWGAETCLKYAKVNYVCSVNYRLSSRRGNRFPAALQDAITSYVYLIDTIKINPNDIIVSGDSAGGNITLALLKYIADNGKTVGLKTPGAALLWSPWVDPRGATDVTRFWLSPSEKTDYIRPEFGPWGYNCYKPLKESEATRSYMDFQHLPFKTATPLWFCAGECEMLLPDILDAAEQFKKIGNNVTESLEKDCPHDIILVGGQIAFEKEGQACAQKAGAWLNKLDWEKVRE